MLKSPLKVIISGGGTGGHVFPAISIAQELKRQVPGVEILFVGAEGRLEMTKVPEAGFRIIGLPVRGFNRKKMISNAGVIVDLLRSMRQSRKILRDFKPDVVVGVGGYASGPVVRVAEMKNIPVLIQEQNSYAGITNRWLARKAETICVAYEEMSRYFPREKIVFTGNPVREEIRKSNIPADYAQSFYKIPTGYRTVLIIGGSLGAGSINRAIMKKISSLGKKPLFVIWQTGKNDFNMISEQVDRDKYPNIVVTEFIEHMEVAFSAADLIVSRAGAGTISELAVVGKPVILVPSPNVAEDHQTKNARALEGRNAAVLIPDNRVDELLVPEILRLLNDDQAVQELSSNIKQLAMPDASTRIVREILKIADRQNKRQ